MDMRNFLDRLLILNTRDIIGLLLWLVVATISCRVLGWRGLLLCLFVMVLREVWQWRHFHLPYFEYEDVARYAIVILLGWIFAMLC